MPTANIYSPINGKLQIKGLRDYAFVFGNGHNIGRYWNVGPQQTLYLPGCWLRKGKNTLTIFEQLNMEQQKEIRAIKTPILDELKK